MLAAQPAASRRRDERSTRSRPRSGLPAFWRARLGLGRRGRACGLRRGCRLRDLRRSGRRLGRWRRLRDRRRRLGRRRRLRWRGLGGPRRLGRRRRLRDLVGRSRRGWRRWLRLGRRRRLCDLVGRSRRGWRRWLRLGRRRGLRNFRRRLGRCGLRLGRPRLGWWSRTGDSWRLRLGRGLWARLGGRRRSRDLRLRLGRAGRRRPRGLRWRGSPLGWSRRSGARRRRLRRCHTALRRYYRDAIIPLAVLARFVALIMVVPIIRVLVVPMAGHSVRVGIAVRVRIAVGRVGLRDAVSVRRAVGVVGIPAVSAVAVPAVGIPAVAVRVRPRPVPVCAVEIAGGVVVGRGAAAGQEQAPGEQTEKRSRHDVLPLGAAPLRASPPKIGASPASGDVVASSSAEKLGRSDFGPRNRRPK